MKPYFIIALLVSSWHVNAQLDSCNVFLKGYYIEAAINWNGALGSSTNTPANFISPATNGSIPNLYTCDSTPRTSARRLAIVADPDRDSTFVDSSVFAGDFIMPGIPQEGWSIMADGRQANAWNGVGPNSYQICDHNIIGSNISYSANHSKLLAIWRGIYTTDKNHKIQITQVATLDTTKPYLTFSVTLKNIDTGFSSNIYYLRTVDPDNDERLSNDFSTRNIVTSKLPNPKNKVMVAAWGKHYTKLFLGLGTEDCRAKSFICTNNLSPTSRIDSIYTGTAPNVRYDSVTLDVGIGLLFSLGNLASGDSTTFSYAYIFKETATDSALASISATTLWSVFGIPTQYRSGDSVKYCDSTNFSEPVHVFSPVYNNWTWSSPSGNHISPTFGNDVTVAVGATTAIVKAIGTSTTCLKPDTIIMVIDPHGQEPIVNISGPNSQSTGGNVIINAVVTNIAAKYKLVWSINGKVVLISTVGSSIFFTKNTGNDVVTVTLIPLTVSCYDSVISNTWTVYNSTAVGYTNSQTNNIQVYPNPLTNEMTVSDLSASDQLTIYDMMGRRVMEWLITKDGNSTFNTKELQTGMYILRVLDKNGNIKARLPIQKL